MTWVWLREDVVLAMHDRQLAEHGGPPGVRDMGAVLSALARPVNRAAYETPDGADLAASYAYGQARNHGFVDGNKRTAWVAARLFLRLNGVTLSFNPAAAVQIVQEVAAGTCGEVELAAWFRKASAGK